MYVVGFLRIGLGDGFTESFEKDPVTNEQKYTLTKTSERGPIEFHKCNGCSWVQANLLCHSKGTGVEVASIHSQEENDYAMSLLDSTTRFVHIGFNDLASNGNWVWTDASPVDYTNWKAGQPQ